ncbi:MAG: nucleotidyltransferase [Desulfuromonadales bacterium]|nr:MAG: nucleotidyltransferase [Desulfuromonadales bacterium]
MTLDLSSLHKAVLSMERALRVTGEKLFLPETSKDEKDLLKAGVIQNFEFTYELCWKFIQRWIRENRTPEDADHPLTRKELFRLAAQYGLIADPLPWFVYGEKRNLTSHTYDEVTAQVVYDAAVQFLPDAQYLYQKLVESND